jgi:hypothetical protein
MTEIRQVPARELVTDAVLPGPEFTPACMPSVAPAICSQLAPAFTAAATARPMP